MSEENVYLTKDSICRLCAGPPKTEDTPNLKPLNESLISQIETNLPIQVCLDIFPPWICSTCLENLNQWTQFMASLHQGQTDLKQKLQSQLALELVWPSWLKTDPPSRSWFQWHFPIKFKPKTLIKRSQNEPTCQPMTEQEHKESPKRARKVPSRLAESVRGTDLDAIFKEDTDLVHSDTMLPVENIRAFVVLDQAKNLEVNAEKMAEESVLIRESFTCDLCSQRFNSNDFLQSHRQSQHKNVFYLCQTQGCGQKYRSLPALTFHQSRQIDHEGFLIIKSHDFSESKKRKTRLLKDEEFRCSMCSATFKFGYLRKRHERFVHSTERPFPCLDCDMKFKTKTNLVAHQRKHTGEQKYFCDICGKTFPYKTSLTSHIRSHEGTKPFQCDVCSKSFTQKGNLKEHLRIHTGEKPFSCHICDSAFKTSSQRALHEKRHFQEKPWKCEFCEKTFLSKDTWKIHLRRHKGEKPFSCNTCHKSFAEGWALKKHNRLHTGERPYECESCDKTFSDVSNLNKHRRHHAESNDPPEAITMFTIIQEGLEGSEIRKSVVNDEGTENVIYIAYADEAHGGEQDRNAVSVLLPKTNVVLPVSHSNMDQNKLATIPDIANVKVVQMSSNEVLKIAEEREASDILFTS